MLTITLTEFQLAFLMDFVLSFSAADNSGPEAIQALLERTKASAEVPEGFWAVVEKWINNEYI